MSRALCPDDERDFGTKIILKACEAPLRQIAQNAGIDGSIVVEKVRESKGSFGYNARTNKYEDLLEASRTPDWPEGTPAIPKSARVPRPNGEDQATVVVRQPIESLSDEDIIEDET